MARVPDALPPAPEPPAEPSSPSVRVRRQPARGRYDTAAVHAVLDAGRVAHVGVVDDGRPVVLPMAYGRRGDRLILHGSRASRVMRAMAAGAEMCITVTVLDGLVLARSAFHHSMNYRAVVVMGRAQAVVGEHEQRAALDALVEHLVPGRTAEARATNDRELRQTLVVEVPLSEASVKARTGGPVDDADDLSMAVWSGVIPLREVAGRPEPDAHTPPGLDLPGYLVEAPR